MIESFGVLECEELRSCESVWVVVAKNLGRASSSAGFMNRVVLIKHLQDVRETLCRIGRARHGSFGISAMDLKKVLDQTVREL